MGVRGLFRSRVLRVSSWYVAASRLFFVAILSMSFFLPALASSTTPQVTVNVTGTNAYTAFGLCALGECTPVTVDGNFTITGPYSGPVYFQGQAAVDVQSQIQGAQTVNWTFSSSFDIPGSGGHAPPMNYPTETASYFSSTHCPLTGIGCLLGYGWSTVDWSVSVCAYSDPGLTDLLGCGTQQSSGNVDTFVLAVAVPLFNDSLLGVSCQTVQSLCQGGPDSLYAYQIPIGGIYNYIMAISLVLLGIGALLAFMGKVALGNAERNTIIMDSVLGIVVILLFPLIYNFVGSILNYVDQAVIAYPNDYHTYGTSLNSVWNQFQSLDTSSWWNVLWDSVNTLAGWVISVILWVLLRLVGTVRLFIFAVVIAGMPLAMGLRLIPFTRKLSQYIEETMFGMLLASLMSAVILGVTAYLFAHWGDASNIFATGGIEERWVAAAALFAAILIPTVFAPLTAFVFQTTSQAAIAAGGVAAMTLASGAAPVAGAGVGMAGLNAGGSVMNLGAGAAGATMGVQQASTSGIQVLSHLGTAAMHGMKNAAVVATTGTLDAIGMRGAAKVMGQSVPITSQRDMAHIVRQKQQGNQAEFANRVAPDESDLSEMMGIPTGVAASPEVQSAAQQRYGNLSNADKTNIMRRMAAAKGVDPVQAAASTPLVKTETWNNLEQKIQSDSSFAGSFYAQMNPDFTKKLDSAVSQLNTLANQHAGPEAWAQGATSRTKSAQAWTESLLTSPDRLVGHLSGHDSSYDLLRQDPSVAHRVISNQVLQQIKNDPQAVWNLRMNLNDQSRSEQPGL